MSEERSFHTIVVGGGQAGLAAAYFLKQKGIDFAVFDSHTRSGESWRERWDSLRLFTPAKFDSLPGMSWQRADFYFPTKNEMADYLTMYAEKFQLPVYSNVTVDALRRSNGGYLLTAGSRRFTATNVIVATGFFHQPSFPPFVEQCDGTVLQLHSSEYKHPDQIPEGSVVVVGAGNSGGEIAIELAKDGRKVWLAGRDVGRIPADTFGRILGGRPYWFFLNKVTNIKTPIGRKMRAKALHHGTPLIRLRTRDIADAGVKRCGRIGGFASGLPRLEEGKVLEVRSIVWATGFRPNYSWIKLSITDDHGHLMHERGVVPQAPGLFFLGIPFQTSLASGLVGGVGADARYIVDQVEAQDNARAAVVA